MFPSYTQALEKLLVDLVNTGHTMAAMLKSFLTLLLLSCPIAFTLQSSPSGSAQNQAAQPQAQPSPAEGQNAAGEQRGEVIEQVKTEVEEGIKHMLVDQIEAWNHGNLQGFMNGYWHSPDLTFFSGTSVTKGWVPTLERYQKKYKSEGAEMGKLEFQDLNIDVLNRRAAVVTGKWGLTMSDGKKPGGLFTLIVKRMQGGWRIVHDHTSGG